MTIKNKTIILTSLLLLLFLSISIASATENNTQTDTTTIIDSTQNTPHTSVNKIKYNIETKGDTNNGNVYVSNNGNTSSNGYDPSNPTTIYNAIRNVEDNGRIILTGNEETTYYNILRDITTASEKNNEKSFTITNDHNNVILNFYSNYQLKLSDTHNITISNLSFTRNHASTKPTISHTSTSLTIDNCTFYGIENTKLLGAIDTTTTLILKDSRFYNNTASNRGGIITGNYANINITNCVFENNTGINGGVLSTENSNITITNSNFKNNTASFGGVFSIRDNSELNVKNSEFINNSAEYNGGVLDLWYSTSILEKSVFRNNRAEYGGISYSINNIKTQIKDSILEDNTAQINANDMYSFRDNLILNNNVIINSRNTRSIYCYNTTYNLNNNWWGSNNPKFNLITNNLLPENWRLMTATANSGLINVSLNSLSDSTTTNKEIFPRIALFQSTSGTFYKNNMTITGTITNTFNNGNINDVTITIDNQVLKISEKLVPYLYLEDIKAKINDNITIKAYANPEIRNVTLKIKDKNIILNLSKGIGTYKENINSSWIPGAYNISITIRDNIRYANTTTNATLTINNNYNSSVTLVSKKNEQSITPEYITIPNKYDLNQALAYQTSVKDQASSGSCWAFSTLATLEAAYLKQYGIEYDFSENNMKNILKKYSAIGEVNDYPTGGDNELEPISYLIGWYGPVLEEEDSYNEYSLMSPFLNSSIKIEDVYFYYRDSYVGKDNNDLKEAILRYGAVASSLYSGYYGSAGTYVYYPDLEWANHAIAIVGWNDYTRQYNFNYGLSNPTGNGAYIIKNSWGTTQIGDNGYQYVSYYDGSLAGINVPPKYKIWYSFSYAFPLNEYQNYTNIYQHDTVSTRFEILTPSAWMRNVYTANKNESIAGVGTFIYEDTDYEVYIYVNDKFAYSQKGTITQEGYRIIKLDQNIPIYEGDVFRADLKLKAHVGDYTSITLQDTNRFKSISEANQSFISTDGENWEDLYTSSDYTYSAVCLKVYTKETPTIQSKLNTTEQYNITTQVNNIDSPGRISYKIDDEYYTTENGEIYYLDITEDGTYTTLIPLKNIEKYEYNITVILETNDYLITENITIAKPTTINITTQNVTYYVDDEQKITATLEIEDNIYNIPLNQGRVVLIENSKIIDTCNVVDGKVEFILNKDEGTYNYTLKYEGSASTSSEKVNVTLKIMKHNVTIRIVSIENNIFGQNAIINGTVRYSDNEKNLTNVNLFTTVDGKSYNVRTDKNGKFSITHTLNRTGKNNISILLYESTAYTQTNYNYTFIANKAGTNLTVNAENTETGKNTTITGKLTDNNNKAIKNATISIYLNNQFIKNVTTNNKGEYNLTVANNQIGETIVKAIYEGDENYNQTNATTTYHVYRIASVIVIDELKETVINNTIIINGTLKSANNDLIKNVLIYIKINNNNYNTTTNANGVFTFTTKDYKLGTNNVTITYQGNDTYFPYTLNTTFNARKIKTTLNVDYLINKNNITLSGKLLDENSNPLGKVNLIIQLNDENISIKTDANGNYNKILTSNKIGQNSITITFKETEYYAPISKQITFTIMKFQTELTINLIQSTTYNQNVTITGTLKNEFNQPIQDTLTIQINNHIYTTTTNKQGTYTLTITTTTIGQNNITVKYSGSSNYTNATQTSKFTTNKQNTRITINQISTAKYNTDVTISGILRDYNENKLNNNQVVLKFNEKTFNLVTDNKGMFKVTTLVNVAGTNLITAIFNGNQYYTRSTSSSSFDVSSISTMITINKISDTDYAKEVTVSGTFTDVNGYALKDRLVANINGELITVTSNNNGVFSFKANTTNVGRNTIKVTFGGNDNYEASNASTYYVALNVPTIINLNSVSNTLYGKQVTIKGSFVDVKNTPLADSNVRVNVNGNISTVKTDKNGLFSFKATASRVGRNTVSVFFNGNTYYKASDNTVSFQTENVTTYIQLNPIPNSMYGKQVTVTGKFTDVTGAPITSSSIMYSVNGVKSSVTTDNKGMFSFKAKTTRVGNNFVSVFFRGNTYYKACEANVKYITENVTTTIKLNKVPNSMYGKQVTVTGTFKDEAGNPLGDSCVFASVNGVKFSVKTNSKGVFTFKANTTRVGKNFISVFFRGNKYYQASEANVNYITENVTTYIKVNKIANTLYGRQVTVTGTFKDQAGNPLFDSNVQVSVNGKTFTVKTDSKGKFTFKANATLVGKNFVSVFFKGNKYYKASDGTVTFNTENVTTRITLNAVKDVQKGNNVTITGTFIDQADNPIKNSYVKVSTCGVTEAVKTNSKGVFTFSTKTTKVGTNTVEAFFNGNSMYLATSTKKTYNVLI